MGYWWYNEWRRERSENMGNNYFILHGSFSSPFSNWIPWLRKEMESQEKIVYTPDMPTGVGFQNYENWEKVLLCYVQAGLINENTIIYAHSIAPIFISKFLVFHKIKVKKLIFVCGFNNYLGINEEYDIVNKSMYFDNLNLIKDYATDIVCYYSDNDPYVSYEAEKEFACLVADKQFVIPNGGHLNSEAGYNIFPELLEYVEENHE